MKKQKGQCVLIYIMGVHWDERRKSSFQAQKQLKKQSQGIKEKEFTDERREASVPEYKYSVRSVIDRL